MISARKVIMFFRLRPEYCTHSWKEVTGYDERFDGHWRRRIPRQLKQCRWCQRCVPLTPAPSSG